MKPRGRRRLVRFFLETFRLSRRRACGPAGGIGGSLPIAVRSELVLESGDGGESLRVEVDVLVFGTPASVAFRAPAPSVGTLFAGTGAGAL